MPLPPTPLSLILMKKVVQKTFQITTEIRENPFNKAQHDQSAKGRGRGKGGAGLPPS